MNTSKRGGSLTCHPPVQQPPDRATRLAAELCNKAEQQSSESPSRNALNCPETILFTLVNKALLSLIQWAIPFIQTRLAFMHQTSIYLARSAITVNQFLRKWETQLLWEVLKTLSCIQYLDQMRRIQKIQDRDTLNQGAGLVVTSIFKEKRSSCIDLIVLYFKCEVAIKKYYKTILQFLFKLGTIRIRKTLN